MARPSKYNPQSVASICEALASGLPRKYAAGAGGISYQTMREWEKAGEAGEEPFVSFLSAIKEAEDKAVVFHLMNITKHSEKAWAASAWFLERRFPEDFARQRLELTGANGGPIEHTFAPIVFTVVPPANAGISSEE